jgi:hypothetical protein
MSRPKNVVVSCWPLLLVLLGAQCDNGRLFSRDCPRVVSSHSEATYQLTWRNASHHELPTLIIHLGSTRQLTILANIARSERCESSLAAAVYLRIAPVDACVSLCRSIPSISSAWRFAIDTYVQRFDRQSLPFLREFAYTKGSSAAYHIFRICRERGWPDLIDVALCHINDHAIIVEANASKGERVLDEAGRYIETIVPGSDVLRFTEHADALLASPDVLDSGSLFDGQPIRLAIEGGQNERR